MASAVAHDIPSLVDHVETCIAQVQAGANVLPQGILGLEGFSNYKVRTLLNLLNTPPNLRYLEVGVWKGSTFVSANYQIRKFEDCGSVAVDDFSEFRGDIARPLFCDTVWEWLGEAPTLVQGHIFSDEVRDELCSLAEVNPFSIYFYDGGHSFEDQRKAISFIEPFLSDVGVLIVDDYRRPEVIAGTKQGLAEVGWHVEFEAVLPGTDGWWEDILVLVWSRPTLDAEQTLDENFDALDVLG